MLTLKIKSHWLMFKMKSLIVKQCFTDIKLKSSNITEKNFTAKCKICLNKRVSGNVSSSTNFLAHVKVCIIVNMFFIVCCHHVTNVADWFTSLFNNTIILILFRTPTLWLHISQSHSNHPMPEGPWTYNSNRLSKGKATFILLLLVLFFFCPWYLIPKG